MAKTIVMRMSENQLRLIQDALEEHFRLRMGQVNLDGLADDLCQQNIDFGDPGTEEHDRLFDNYIERRENAMQKLREFMDICFDNSWERKQKTENVICEIDIWHVIRHFFWKQKPPEKRLDWTVDAYPPSREGTEPLPTVEVLQCRE